MKTGDWIMAVGYTAIVLTIAAGFKRVERAIDNLPEDLLKTLLNR